MYVDVFDIGEDWNEGITETVNGFYNAFLGTQVTRVIAQIVLHKLSYVMSTVTEGAVLDWNDVFTDAMFSHQFRCGATFPYTLLADIFIAVSIYIILQNFKFHVSWIRCRASC
ncbi:hypothetical protein ACJX0J_027677 [Zea mays]